MLRRASIPLRSDVAKHSAYVLFASYLKGELLFRMTHADLNVKGTVHKLCADVSKSSHCFNTDSKVAQTVIWQIYGSKSVPLGLNVTVRQVLTTWVSMGSSINYVTLLGRIFTFLPLFPHPPPPGMWKSGQ